MSGWVILAALAAASAAAFWLLRLRGAMLQLAGAALLFGSAGYALQGHPGLFGSPREARAAQAPVPLTEFRHAFFGNFTPTEHWLVMSESIGRRGDTSEGVAVMQSAIREHPGDSQLWIGLGNALMDHSMVLTPAAEFAYRRAAELAPGHPAPPFFMGLALARSGDRNSAIALWKELLASAPAEAEWRPMVEAAVTALEEPRPAPPQQRAGG